jgi:hypothetical protein
MSRSLNCAVYLSAYSNIVFAKRILPDWQNRPVLCQNDNKEQLLLAQLAIAVFRLSFFMGATLPT